MAMYRFYVGEHISVFDAYGWREFRKENCRDDDLGGSPNMIDPAEETPSEEEEEEPVGTSFMELFMNQEQIDFFVDQKRKWAAVVPDEEGFEARKRARAEEKAEEERRAEAERKAAEAEQDGLTD